MTGFIKDTFYKPCMPSPNSKHIDYIDLTKGICILLVILHHSYALDFEIPGLKAVRMPLYFMLSGLFFKNYGSLKNLIIKKINRILIPYLTFFVFGCLMYLTINSFRDCPITPFEYFFTDCYHSKPGYNVAVWFLLCLFEVNVIFCLITLITSSIPIIGLLSLIFGLLGECFDKNGILLPFYLCSSFSALPFFYLGYILKRSSYIYNGDRKYSLIYGLASIILAVTIYFVYDGPNIDFAYNRYTGNIILIYTASAIGVIGLLLICKYLKWLPFISYFGKYSIIPLCVHVLFLYSVNMAFKYLFGMQFDNLIGTISFFTSVILSWLCIPFFRYRIPYLVAQKDLIKIKSSC